MVNAKGIGIFMLIALGIPPYYAQNVLPDDLVEGDANQDYSPITAKDGEQTQAQESAPQLEQNPPTLLLEEEKPVETSDNFSVALINHDSKQSHNPSLTPLNQIEDLNDHFTLPLIPHQTGGAGDLLHLIQRSHGIPRSSEISGTFYTLNILPPDLDISYEPKEAQVHPNQNEEPSHQTYTQLSGRSLSQGLENFYETASKEANNTVDYEHSNDTIQQKEGLYEETSQDVPEIHGQKSVSSGLRESNMSTDNEKTELKDLQFDVLEEPQAGTEDSDRPKRFGNTQDQTLSEAITISHPHKPGDHIQDIHLTTDWPQISEISQSVAVSAMNDSIEEPQNGALQSDTRHSSGNTSTLIISSQDQLGAEASNTAAKKLEHLNEDIQVMQTHITKDQEKVTGLEQTHPQIKPEIAALHENQTYPNQNLSNVIANPLNSVNTSNSEGELADIFDNQNNESNKNILANIYQQEFDDAKSLPTLPSQILSESHSVFVEVLPLNHSLQRTGWSPSAAEEAYSQINDETEAHYKTHSNHFPENAASEQRDMALANTTAVPEEQKPVSSVSNDHLLHSPIKDSEEFHSDLSVHADQLLHSPIKETKGSILAPSGPTETLEAHTLVHSPPEGSHDPILYPHNNKYQHSDISIEGRSMGDNQETDIITITLPKHQQELHAARQPRRSHGGLTPLFTPPESREDLKHLPPDSSAEEENAGAPYQFSYKVKDRAQGADFGHQEGSDGTIVRGQYFVVLPDGRRQTVQYRADHVNGYQSEVEYQPGDVSAGGFISGNALVLEQIFSSGNNNNWLNTSPNNNVDNQYQAEVLHTDDALNQNIGNQHQYTPNEEVSNEYHQDGGSDHSNSLADQEPEQLFHVSNDQYQTPADTQFQHLSSGKQQGFITDDSHFNPIDFDGQFHTQGIVDQPFESNHYQTLNSENNFQPFLGNEQFSPSSNGDHSQPANEDQYQYQESNQFQQSEEITNNKSIEPSLHSSHQPGNGVAAHSVNGENQYQPPGNGDHLPITEGSLHQIQENGVQNQPSVSDQYEVINGNDQFVLQHEGNPSNILAGSEHIQVNGDLNQFPQSSGNSPIYNTDNGPLNVRTESNPSIVQLDDNQFHPFIHGDQFQPPFLNDDSNTFQTQTFLDPDAILTSENSDFSPSYSSNEYETSIETIHDQTPNYDALQLISNENFPQRRDVHHVNHSASQVPSTEHLSIIRLNEDDNGDDFFQGYYENESSGELSEIGSTQHFEDGSDHDDDSSFKSFQAEVLCENEEGNSFQGEHSDHTIPEVLEEDNQYSETSTD
ncbi:uncharacterized protein [Macrobrachium rosenbergii]|uniref:uncharacterized protein n=1 Tax=Macrobrachium rosenbergii TaxID=79674 RepID=UPI0034D664ED